MKHPASPRSSSFDSQQKWQALSFEALKAFELPDGMLQIRDSATAPA